MTARIAYLSTGAARCTFPYSAGLVQAIKHLVPATHRRYDPDDHSWTVEPPYGPRVSLEIAEVYPDVEIEHGASVRSPEPMSAALDPDYRVLHLLPTAPSELVESAYRTLARLHHPDAGECTDTMMAINSAMTAIRERMS